MVFMGIEAVRRLETWFIKNHGFQPQYAVPELSEKNFWRMFDGGLYEHCRRKYRAIGTFMSVYYNSKKGKKTENGLPDAEQEPTELETPEVDEPAN
uniref:DWARF1/DIMINUTO n=1 Tax=Solanum tuberosum TaxID=4113 RepID=M0ZYW4_SOLTU